MRRLLLPALICLLAPACAHAAVVDLGSSDHGPRVAVDGAGTGYITWADSTGSEPLNYCRIAADAAACNATKTFTFTPGGSDNGDDTGNQPLLDGNVVRIVDGRCCASSDTWLFTSTAGGASFPDTGVKVGTSSPSPTGGAVVLPANLFAPSTPERIAFDADGPVTSGGFFQATGVTTPTVSTSFDLSPAGDDTYTEDLTLTGTTLFAVFTDLNDEVVYWRQYNGTGDINSASSWTAPAVIGQANIDSGARVVSGPSGIYVAYNTGAPSGEHVVLTKFTGSGWTAPITLSDIVGNDFFALAEDSAGIVHFSWQDATGALRYRYARTAANTDFTRAQTLGTGGGFVDQRLSVDAAGVGWLVWRDLDSGHVFATTIHPGEPPIPPPPGGGGGGGTSTPAAYKGKTVTHSKSVSGGLYVTLNAPKTCVLTNQSFVSSVGTRIKHKLAHGKHLAVTKVVFGLDGHTVKTIKKKPFHHTFAITAASTSKHTITAKVTVRIRRKHHKTKTVTKTVKATVSIC